ncbi:MAG TPA: ABC transporter permease [Acidobacteriaceae bacterium]|nr:ABC transporter permease [Acidobacteriaceae bacterium]
MLSRVWLIARREYRERVRTRGFVITTILIPLLMGGFVFGSIFLGSKTVSDRHIAVVSIDTELALDLQTELEREQRQRDDAAASSAPAAAKKTARIFVDAMNSGPEVRGELNQELESGDLDGYLWITPAAVAGGRPTFAYTSKSGGDAAMRGTLASALDRVLIREQLAHRGVVATEMDAMLQPVKVAAVERGPHTDTESAKVSVSVLFFIMYLVIMLYGMNVARSIIEEKTSRIFEVLLAAVRPEAMMAGKIIGVGAVGLTQVGIWLTAGFVLAAASAAIHLGGDTIHITISGMQIVFFLIYFILGYLFYSSIAAALGAMTNSEQELQQLNMFLMIPLLLCFGMLGPLLTAPDSTLARVMALIPPFTPLLMYMRVSLGHPAVWEVAASIVLLSVSICGIIWVTSRIYRVGVLMYGKRPSVREILRWLKYS